ncbi:hypothetical protein OQA88_6016 [Cercophora sp. LCS_1]
MKAFTIAAALASVAMAAPADVSPRSLSAPAATPPSSVRVIGVSLLGSGCPAGSADVQIDATKTLMEVTFSQYYIETGPGTRASDWRRNCKLTLNLAFDEGFQFATLATDMKGFAQIPSGARGLCTNTFDFTGISGQSAYAISLPGPREGPFTLKADPDVTSWSPCGGTTSIMNMNTQCNISPTQQQALIAVDRISGKLTLNVALEWRKHTLEQLQAHVPSLAKIAKAPGVTLRVIHRGKVVHQQYYGYGDVEARLPVDQNTVFLMASLTKAITAATTAYPGKLAIWHGGNMPGVSNAICLLPESDTANYNGLATKCVEETLKSTDKVNRSLEKEQIHGTNPRSADSYAGRYYNTIKNWFIDIKVLGDALYLEFLGRPDEQYPLRHYHGDTFAWNGSYNEMVGRGQYVRDYRYYRIEFEEDESLGNIGRLRWRHDTSVPEGELFFRTRTEDT